jgi:hypothetical protein
MPIFKDIKPGVRLRDSIPLAQRRSCRSLNLEFRVDGRVGECLVYRGEENSRWPLSLSQEKEPASEGLRLLHSTPRIGSDHLRGSSALVSTRLFSVSGLLPTPAAPLRV